MTHNESNERLREALEACKKSCQDEWHFNPEHNRVSISMSAWNRLKAALAAMESQPPATTEAVDAARQEGFEDGKAWQRIADKAIRAEMQPAPDKPL